MMRRVALKEYLYQKTPLDLGVFFRFGLFHDVVQTRYYTPKLDSKSLVPQVKRTPLRTSLATNIASLATQRNSHFS